MSSVELKEVNSSSYHVLVSNSKYRRSFMATQFWFETALDYKPQILDPQIEEFPCLVHKLSVTLTALQLIQRAVKNGVKIFKPLHRGAICEFLFRWIHYCHSSKSTGKKTYKIHVCALVIMARVWYIFNHNSISLLYFVDMILVEFSLSHTD